MAVLQQFDCPLTADFTGTDVPVTIAFNGVTQNDGTQTFCYTVTQVEEPIALSHFVLEICPTITEEDLVSVTVTINNEEQTVEIGDNVEIFNPPDTDPTTGCPGIKFDFGLEEAGDVMVACFEVAGNFEVGPVEACIKGGDTVATGQFVCGPVCGEVEICETTVFQNIDVCVPVTVTPSTLVGDINVRCCGPATVSTVPCPTTGPTSCTFFVRQRLCAEVPISFSAVGDSGVARVTCGTPNEEGCVDCPEDNEDDI